MGDNLGLVTYVKRALSERWGYVWGTFGQVLTPDLFAAKVRQYPGEVGWFFDFIKSNWVGKRTTDCVGLIKGYYWGEGNYVGATDVSADGMLQRATEKGSIETMPDIPGLCVCKLGHIGVYIGDGQVIEAHGTKYGVIQTPLKGGTPWTNWCKCPYIDYLSSPVEQPKPVSKHSNNTALIQGLCNTLGIKDKNGSRLDVDGEPGPLTASAVAKLPVVAKGSSSTQAVRTIQQIVDTEIDGSFGPMTKQAVIAWQVAHNLVADGVVGPKTWARMAGL